MKTQEEQEIARRPRPILWGFFYDGDKAIVWCAYGLKDEFPRIDSGRNYRRLGVRNRDPKLWRITCFFVDRDYRKRGVAWLALEAAIDSIKNKGGGTVEA